MRTKDVLRYYSGSWSRITAVLNLSRNRVYQWGEFVPKPSAMELDIKTKGDLKYDPDFYEGNPPTSKYETKSKGEKSTSRASGQSAA